MNKTRPNQVTFRLSDEELQTVKKKIEKSGMNQQEYLRKVALGTEIVNTDGIKEIYPELKKQGSNLNQLVKKLHERGFIDYKEELPRVLKGVEDTWRLLRQYLQKQE